MAAASEVSGAAVPFREPQGYGAGLADGQDVRNLVNGLTEPGWCRVNIEVLLGWILGPWRTGRRTWLES